MIPHFALGEIFQDLHVVAIPTRTTFRGITVREAAIFRGRAGWSEFSPFLEYDHREAKTWLKAAIEGAYQEWPTARRDSIEINATLPRVHPDEVKNILANFSGCTTVKIKVDDFEADSYLVEAVLDLIPDAKIRLDVNGGWTLQQALLYLHDYHLRFGKVFEYIEQPCQSLSDLAKLKSEIPFKIAVDEAIRKSLDSDFHELKEYADVAIIKWAPTGGITAALELIAQIGLPTVISSALDTGIGISHNVALACALDNLPFACGLGTVALLSGDVVVPAVTSTAGKMFRNRAVPNESALEKYRASADRAEWWQNRIQAIWNGGLSDEIQELGWLK